jgi:hypothetical protein
MKIEVKAFNVECDNCGKEYYDDHNGWSMWSEFEHARDSAIDSDWIESECGEKHYCKDCFVEFDEEDNIVLVSKNEAKNR